MNTQKETTKKAIAPETRYTAEQIEKQISEHKYIPRAAMGDSPAHCPDCEGTHCPGIGAATGEGSVPRDFFNLNTPNREDSAYSHHEYKDIDVRNLTRGQLIESYCDLKARNAELLAACKNLVRQIERDNLSGRYNVGAVNAEIANAEGRAQ